MAALTIQQRTLIYQLCFHDKNFVTLTQRRFRRINGPAYTPSSRMVRAIINKFETTNDRHQNHKWQTHLEPQMTDIRTTNDRHRSGQPRHSRSLENIESVRQDVLSSPNKSVTSRSVPTAPNSRIIRATHFGKRFTLFIHKKLSLFNIFPADYEKRVQFAQSFLEIFREENKFDLLMISAEAHFHENGFVSKQISDIWLLRIHKWCKKNYYIRNE